MAPPLTPLCGTLVGNHCSRPSYDRYHKIKWFSLEKKDNKRTQSILSNLPKNQFKDQKTKKLEQKLQSKADSEGVSETGKIVVLPSALK